MKALYPLKTTILGTGLLVADHQTAYCLKVADELVGVKHKKFVAADCISVLALKPRNSVIDAVPVDHRVLCGLMGHGDKKKSVQALYLTISGEDLSAAIDMMKFDVGETEIKTQR